MTKQIKFLAILCIALLMLVGCNTAKDQDTTDETSTTEGNNASNDNTEKDEQPTESDDVTEKESKTITYTTNGEQKQEETTAVNSDEQQYSIEILPSFTLTAEEPGKDMLYLTENGSISMRIETMSVNDQTYENLIANTEEMMNAVDETVHPTNFDIQSYIANHSDITNYAAYKVDLVDEIVTAVVFEKANQLVRLTIFDDPNVDLTEAMIKMGLTISKS
ncbi:hypothetical protein [Ureibacillus acetophenoni]|uniref:Lipoprotein n=1 Tax=Ureibacillus acetophenoni TaxID=614649 RepID=A0A285TZS1_9BACL|nr:hypothetical protein [Ureibacillus acetophenoni]SOC35155.1 hypothetical protein SAMN05877842_101283 [Ureibacillus acetophenoni]